MTGTRARRGLTWADVVSMGLELPGVEVGSAYGSPALRVRGAFMCRIRDDNETLVVRCDLDERPLLVGAHPESLFVTAHYEAWPMVLVRLPQADAGLVRELVEDAWAERAPKRVVAAFVAAREDGP